MAKTTRGPEMMERRNFLAEPEMIRRINDFRFQQRINSLSETVRELVAAGLAVKERMNDQESMNSAT